MAPNDVALQDLVHLDKVLNPRDKGLQVDEMSLKKRTEIQRSRPCLNVVMMVPCFEYHIQVKDAWCGRG